VKLTIIHPPPQAAGNTAFFTFYKLKNKSVKARNENTVKISHLTQL